MTRPSQSGDSYRFEPADVTAERARSRTVETTTSCGLCPGWSFVGTQEDGQRAFREHANQTHPRVDRGQKARRRAAGQSSWPKDAT